MPRRLVARRSKAPAELHPPASHNLEGVGRLEESGSHETGELTPTPPRCVRRGATRRHRPSAAVAGAPSDGTTLPTRLDTRQRDRLALASRPVLCSAPAPQTLRVGVQSRCAPRPLLCSAPAPLTLRGTQLLCHRPRRRHRSPRRSHPRSACPSPPWGALWALELSCVSTGSGSRVATPALHQWRALAGWLGGARARGAPLAAPARAREGGAARARAPAPPPRQPAPTSTCTPRTEGSERAAVVCMLNTPLRTPINPHDMSSHPYQIALGLSVSSPHTGRPPSNRIGAYQIELRRPPRRAWC